MAQRNTEMVCRLDTEKAKNHNQVAHHNRRNADGVLFPRIQFELPYQSGVPP